MFLCFIDCERAIYGIVLYDILSIVLVIPLLKSIGACATFSDYKKIKLYRDLRYLHVFLLLIGTIGFICFFGVKILSVKKEVRGPFVQRYLPYCILMFFFTAFELHVSKVVASAAWEYN
jgi:hypothetical protein